MSTSEAVLVTCAPTGIGRAIVGRLGRDQVTDYARRRDVSVADAERWLAPNLGYRSDNE